ncbi:MAG: helix-turn-helix domain-containing protein [Ktedonobacteraceae bacterium]
MGQPNELLRTAREYRHWTQAQVAEMIECPQSVAISRWENGITFPSRHYRERLCKLYGKTARELGLEQSSAGVDAPPVFLFNEPLADPQELYGRRREKETVLARTAHKASTSITGPRRIGKTWLLRYLRLIGPERLGTRFSIGYLDGMSPQCKTVAGFVAEACTTFGLPLPQINEGLLSLDKGLRQLMAKKLVPVLCIDEFDSFSSSEEFTLDFFAGLRAMTHTSDLVLVIASKNPLHLVVRKSVSGSPFFNIFERLALKPFTYTEAEHFIQDKSTSASFEPDERDYLWTFGKEHEDEKAWAPLRLQLAGKILCEELDDVRKNPHYRQSFVERFQMLYEAVMD